MPVTTDVLRMAFSLANSLLLAINGLAVAYASPDEVQAVELFRMSTLEESSGASLSRTQPVIWTHEDAGNPSMVYAFSPLGELLAEVHVENGLAEDWEDISVAMVNGEEWIYLGDVGDAYTERSQQGLRYRTEFEILRFAAPTIDDSAAKLTTTAEIFTVKFENDEGINVESIAVFDSGEIILIEKVYTPNQAARVWLISTPRSDELNVPSVVGTVSIVGASGADISVDGTTMVVRNAKEALVFDLDGELAQALAEPTGRYDLPSQVQGEAIAFTTDGLGFIVTSEGRNQPVWFVPMTPEAAPAFGPAPLPAPDVPPSVTATPAVTEASSHPPGVGAQNNLPHVIRVSLLVTLSFALIVAGASLMWRNRQNHTGVE